MKKRRLKRTLFLLLAIPAALLALAGLLFLAVSIWANSVRLPERLKTPPLALEQAFKGTQAVKAKSISPLLSREELAKIQEYDDYLRLILAKNPRLESVNLYLQLRKRYVDEDIEKSFEPFYMTNDSESDDPTADPEFRANFAHWQSAHAGFLDLLRRFARAGPLPQPPLDERATGSHLILARNYSLYLQCIAILGLNARLRIREHDDTGGIQDLTDSLELIDRCHSGYAGVISQGTLSALLMNFSRSVHFMVTDTDYSVTVLQKLIPLLERAEQQFLTPTQSSQTLIQVYLYDRCQIVAEMETGSWRSSVYGWSAEDPFLFDAFHFSIKLGGTRKVTLPRLDRYALDAFHAIHNRLHAAEALEKYDKWQQEEIEIAKQPYAQVKAAVSKWSSNPAYHSFLVPKELFKAIGNVYFKSKLRALTEFHLTRLGAMWRVDPKATLARRAEDFAGHPDHPWRDPFTERPLMIDTATTPTLIWSLGPDLIDQHGAEQSDDIAIRVPR